MLEELLISLKIDTFNENIPSCSVNINARYQQWITTKIMLVGWR